MGIEKRFNGVTGKWEWRGYRLKKEYSTEAEADADKMNVWAEHMLHLEARSMMITLFLPYRYA